MKNSEIRQSYTGPTPMGAFSTASITDGREKTETTRYNIMHSIIIKLTYIAV